MRIVRFITPQDEVRYGLPLDEHSAEVLNGDPLQGLTTTSDAINFKAKVNTQNTNTKTGKIKLA